PPPSLLEKAAPRAITCVSARRLAADARKGPTCRTSGSGRSFAGLLGTTALTALISLPRLFGMKSVDMVSALGAFVSGKQTPEQTFLAGVLVHYVLGLVFAVLYLVGFPAFRFPFNPLTCPFSAVFP